MKPTKCAVIGTGHLGKIHARLLKQIEDIELVAIADPDEAARSAVAADCGNGLSIDRESFAIFIDESDFDLSLGSYEKLRVRFRAGEDAAFVGPCDFFSVIVAFFAVVAVVVAFVSLFGEEVRGEQSHCCKCYIGNFHVVG